MVDLIAIIIGVIIGLLIMYALLRNCGDNPQYEAWLTQDKAKYPELYDE